MHEVVGVVQRTEQQSARVNTFTLCTKLGMLFVEMSSMRQDFYLVLEVSDVICRTKQQVVRVNTCTYCLKSVMLFTDLNSRRLKSTLLFGHFHLKKK